MATAAYGVTLGVDGFETATILREGGDGLTRMTAENSPKEKPGTGPGETRGDGRASAMRTPTPGASMSGKDGEAPAIGE
jgi:hypothetical protein